MPITACLRAILPSLALVVTTGAALANAAQDCRDATLTAEERESACAAATGEASSYQQLAFTHLDAGRPEEALVAARRAIEIADYLTSESPEEGMTAPLRAEEFGPWYEFAQSNLLQALAQTGAGDEAIAAYREAQAAGLKRAADYRANGLAWGLYMAGEHEKALPIVEEWLAAHPEPLGDPSSPEYQEYSFMLDTAAHVMAAAGQTEEAVDTFLRAVEIEGTGLRILYKTQLTNLGFASLEGEEGFEAALRACVATGEACKLY